MTTCIAIRAVLTGACFAVATHAVAEPVQAAPVAAVPASPDLIPWPAKAQMTADAPGFALGNTLPVCATPEIAKEVALALSLAGVKTAAAADGKGALATTIDPAQKAALGDEGYTLAVTAQGITLTAATPTGIFRGATTLAQAVVKDGIGKPTIPAMTVTDNPRIAWRGFMLDVSRHFFDKAEIMQTLDQMASLKLNVFHWHLTDDHGWRIEIKKYPKLTSVGAWHPVGPWEKGNKHSKDGIYGGFYTQEEIREIVAYAAARHIQVMPEIDMPAHMSAVAAAYPEFSPANGWTPSVAIEGVQKRCAALCVARPQVVQFCKDVLMEVMTLFPSKEIHIGGDEVFYEQWVPCPDMQAMKEKLGGKKASWEDVQIAFGNDIAAFLEGNGRTAVCWNNIYKQTVDKRVINHFWRNMNNARDFAHGGYRVMMSPYVYYFSLGPKLENVYQYDPLAVGIKPENQDRIAGIEACIWTERIPDFASLQRTLHPRLAALAESVWTPLELKNWDSFNARAAKSPLNPQPAAKPAPQPKEPIVNVVKQVELKTTPKISSVTVVFAKGESVTPVRVEISTDGVVWNTVYDQTPADRAPLTVKLAAPAETRFIRVVNPKANGKNEMPVSSIECR